MHTNKNAPGTVPAVTRANENLAGHLDSDHATPHHLTLHPTSGTGWWSWCISINGRPAIRFRDLNHATRALDDLLDDMENGVDITRRAALSGIALGAMVPGCTDSDEYEICKGWA